MYVICVIDLVILLFIARMFNVMLVVKRVTLLDTRSHSSYSFESNQSGSNSDNGHSNEGKTSGVRFTQNTTGMDNTLKQRVRVDRTYTDTGAEVSIVTEATSRILGLTL